MGCISSKKALRTNSFRHSLHGPFPRVAAIPILEDFLLANNPDQFVALICKTSSTNKLSAATEIESSPSFISKDDEGKETENGNYGTEGLDLQVETSLEKEEPEKHKSTEEELEQNNAMEEDKPLIVINTWELMEGLEDEKAGQTLENPVGNIEIPRVAITPRRSKHVECFHTMEEYYSFLATDGGSLLNRNSKRYLYYLGHKYLEMVKESPSNQLFNTSSLPLLEPKPRNMTAVVIDWKEDSEDDGNCAPESSVLKAGLGQSDTRIEVSSQENNNAETVAESNCSEENNHIPDTNMGNGSPTETNLEKKECNERTSGKTRLHERAKVNELGSFNIPSSPDLPTVGSLRDWLYSGGHLYSPGVSTTPHFGSCEHGDQWPKLENNSNSTQFQTDKTEIEIHSCCALDDNESAVNTMESGAFCDSSLSTIEDFPLFDPELLASLEKAVEQLSEDEKCILRHIDDYLNSPGRDPGDSELILQDSSEDIQIQNKFHSNEEQNSNECKDAQEMSVVS